MLPPDPAGVEPANSINAHLYEKFIYTNMADKLSPNIRNVNFSLGMIQYVTYGEVVSTYGMFEMNCLLSPSSISTWGTIKTNTYLYRAIQYLHNGV